MKVLLTGASGFIGRAVMNRLVINREAELRIAVRRKPHGVSTAVEIQQISALDGTTDWLEAVTDTNVVIHLAARVHVMNDQCADPLDDFRAVNVQGTLNLARQAAAAGVQRFVFISSIKVNGEQTLLGKPFTADELPAPEDPYGISKLAAEQGLLQLARDTCMEVVIIRLPLVYGPGVKGNFVGMLTAVKKGYPLPLGSLSNQRSLVGLDNVVDLIITCIDHPAAANQVFLAADGEDLSTTELLRRVASAMGKPSRLLPVPASILMVGAAMLGKKAVARRLLGSLQVDISKTRELLGWQPPVSVDEGLKRCVAPLMEGKRK